MGGGRQAPRIFTPHGPQVHPGRPRRAGGALPAAAAPLVPPARPRPRLAAHPRPLPDRGGGVHAAADPGGAGGGILPALPRALPVARGAGPRLAGRGARELGWSGILPAGGEPAPARARGPGSPRGPHPRGPRRAPPPPRCRTLYRGGGGELRLRAADPRGGHQRGPGDPPGLPPAGRDPRPDLGDGRPPSPALRPARLELQPGDHGARRHRLHRPPRPLRALSRAPSVRQREGLPERLTSPWLPLPARPGPAPPRSSPPPAAAGAARRNSPGWRPDRAGPAWPPWGAPRGARAARPRSRRPA